PLAAIIRQTSLLSVPVWRRGPTDCVCCWQTPSWKCNFCRKWRRRSLFETQTRRVKTFAPACCLHPVLHLDCPLSRTFSVFYLVDDGVEDGILTQIQDSID